MDRLHWDFIWKSEFVRPRVWSRVWPRNLVRLFKGRKFQVNRRNAFNRRERADPKRTKWKAIFPISNEAFTTFWQCLLANWDFPTWKSHAPPYPTGPNVLSKLPVQAVYPNSSFKPLVQAAYQSAFPSHLRRALIDYLSNQMAAHNFPFDS